MFTFQWKEAKARFEKDLEEKNEVLSNFRRAYENEKTVQIKIMDQKEKLQGVHESLEQENLELLEKLKRLEKSNATKELVEIDRIEEVNLI